MSNSNRSKTVQTYIRRAVVCTLVGLVCVLLFLLFGFRTWSVGIGVFLGFPLLLVGVGLYLFAVYRDLRQRDVL